MENIKAWMHFANKKTKKIFSYVNDQVLFNLHVFTDLRGEGGIGGLFNINWAFVQQL